MTREEMLKRYIVRESETEQAAIGYLDGVFGGGKHQDLYVRLFMAGAQWADEHPKDNLVDIDKACEWLNNNADKYASMHVGGYESETYPYVTDDLVKDFKKYVEEQI